MKKLFAVLLTVCLMLGMFSACSNGKDTVDDPANTGAENGLSVSKEPIKDLVTYVVASQEMSTFNILYSQSTNETQVLTNCIDGLLSHDNYADAEAYMLDKVITLPLYKVVSWEMTHVNDYSKIYAPYGIQINKFKNWETSVDLYTTEDYAKLAAIYEANAAK